jgi:membrane protease YdiL (CAAX protease family)
VIGAARRAAPEPLLLCAGLAAAVALRLGLAGKAGSASLPAGMGFGGALLVLAVAGGWRPGRVSWRAAAWGVAGGAALLLVPVALRLGAGTPWRLGSPAAALPVWAVVVTLVAVAEEALLRGALMGALLRRVRPEAAVLVAAVAFAALHVPVYGWVAAPLDLAVGVWLGGLRLATGGAGAPALAHTVADLTTWWLR